ncbi:DUF2218 domain-containing protein [Actinacidiphila acidipaludis]|uniref:DUF2218 domain-containing protein n=1 Tax=Actinacidiphila acidipaludis TaxID=2873382 RepID=A0ABS7QGU1_9ACTN|nr:DUF2218 domain-containing protein [Streptomyces acidipaludis]MBY8882016.1 DUF2218 domain-containing protein [Streptomyces acidipaludis]
MPTAEAHLTTDRPSRYLVQLCRHLAQMNRMSHGPLRGHGAGRTLPAVQHVDYTETHGVVRFAEGEWTLDATAETLCLRVEADDEQALQRLQDAISARIEKIGRRDGLEVQWRPGGPDAHQRQTDSDPASGTLGAPGRHLSRRPTWLLAAAGAVIVAVHLGIGGAALSHAKWTGWTANAVLVLLLVKLLLMGSHLLLGRTALRREIESRRWKKRHERGEAGTAN